MNMTEIRWIRLTNYGYQVGKMVRDKIQANTMGFVTQTIYVVGTCYLLFGVKDK